MPFIPIEKEEPNQSGVIIPDDEEENIFMTRTQFREVYEAQKKQSLGRRAWNVVKEMPSGAYNYFSDAWGEAMADESLIKGLFNFFNDEEQKNAGSAIGGAFELGSRDLYRMGKPSFRMSKTNSATSVRKKNLKEITNG